MSTKKRIEVHKILERVKIVHGLKKDGELANLLGLKQNTLSTWKKRNTMDAFLIFEVCDDVDKDWLLYGEGSPDIDHDLETQKINQMLKGMTKDQKRDVLKYIEKEKLWRELMDEREDKKKGA
jgi:hypothetical protein